MHLVHRHCLSPRVISDATSTFLETNPENLQIYIKMTVNETFKQMGFKINITRTDFHKDITLPHPPFLPQYSMGYMVSSTYLFRCKQKWFKMKMDAQLTGLMGGRIFKNVTFRSELHSLCLRILSPSTWTCMRTAQMIPPAPGFKQEEPGGSACVCRPQRQNLHWSKSNRGWWNV